jgi:hypothetical protein
MALKSKKPKVSFKQALKEVLVRAEDEKLKVVLPALRKGYFRLIKKSKVLQDQEKAQALKTILFVMRSECDLLLADIEDMGSADQE